MNIDRGNLGDMGWGWYNIDMKLYVYGLEKDLSGEQKARLEKIFGGGRLI